MQSSARTTHSEHLRDPVIAAEYLNAALDDGDPSVILMALRNVAEVQEGGIAGVAERAELGRESMYKMLSSSGNPKSKSIQATNDCKLSRSVLGAEYRCRRASKEDLCHEVRNVHRLAHILGNPPPAS